VDENLAVCRQELDGHGWARTSDLSRVKRTAAGSQTPVLPVTRAIGPLTTVLCFSSVGAENDLMWGRESLFPHIAETSVQRSSSGTFRVPG
jgi:hypothetical protein